GVVKGVSVSSILLIGLTFFLDFRTSSRLFFLLDWLFLIFLMASVRFGLRLWWDWRAKRRNKVIRKKTVLIFGAGELGSLAYQFLIKQKDAIYDIVGFIDDDPTKRHKTLHGKKVIGNYFNIDSLVKMYKVDEILFATPSIPSYKIVKTIQVCREANVQYKFFPTLHDKFIPNSCISPSIETHLT